jgi:hypothetical protein
VERDAPFWLGLCLSNKFATSGKTYLHVPRHKLALAGGGRRFEGVKLNVSVVCKGSGVKEKEPFYGLRKRT